MEKKESITCHRTLEIIQSDEQKEKRVKNSEKSLQDVCNTIKRKNIHIMGIPEGEKKKDRK